MLYAYMRAKRKLMNKQYRPNVEVPVSEVKL